MEMNNSYGYFEMAENLKNFKFEIGFSENTLKMHHPIIFINTKWNQFKI